MNIGIIGLGYVGLTLAIAADNGINVYGMEVNPYIKHSTAAVQAHYAVCHRSR